MITLILITLPDSKIKKEKVKKEEEQNIKEKVEDVVEAMDEIEKKPSTYRPFDIANLTRPDKPVKKSREDPLELWKQQRQGYTAESDSGKLIVLCSQLAGDFDIFSYFETALHS